MKPPARAAAFLEAWNAFNEDKCQRLAASIAFSTIFSIAPLFVVLIAVVGHVLDANGGHAGHQTAEAALLARVRTSAGDQAADAVRKLVEASFSKPRQGLIASIVAWIVFAIGASGLFAALQDALNAIWHVDASGTNWKRLVRDRLTSFGMIVVVGFLLLVTFVLNQAIAIAAAFVPAFAGQAANVVLATIAGQVSNVAVAVLVFASLFKILPDARVEWRAVWPGALATSILFTIGETLIALYFRFAGVTSAYGAAGSLLVLLLWLYYSAFILLYGAEYTKIDATRRAGADRDLTKGREREQRLPLLDTR